MWSNPIHEGHGCLWSHIYVHVDRCSVISFVNKVTYIYRVSRGECIRLRENVPYVKVHRYSPKHLYPKLNGYGDNGERSLKV